MIANETSLKANSRLSRIQKVSASLRTFFLCVAIAGGLGGVQLLISALTPHLVEPQKIVDGAIALTWAAGYWFTYRLFLSFSSGNLFGAKSIRNLRRMGYIGILLGIEKSASSLIFTVSFFPPWSNFLIAVLLLFFSTIPGFAILCIAWILDEGRKIQEEQELTV
jgi:hypothetical protein